MDTKPQLNFGSAALDAALTNESDWPDSYITTILQQEDFDMRKRLRYEAQWFPSKEGREEHYIIPGHRNDFYRYCGKFGFPRGRSTPEIQVHWMDSKEDFMGISPQRNYTVAPYIHFTHGWYLNPLFERRWSSYAVRYIEDLIAEALNWHFDHSKEIEVDIVTGAPVVSVESEPFQRYGVPIFADYFG